MDNIKKQYLYQFCVVMCYTEEYILMFQKFLLPGPICAAAAFTAGKETGTSDVSKVVEGTSKTDSCKHCHIPPKLRPSELPFYGGEQEKGGRLERVVEEPSRLEQMIGAMRKEVWVFYDQYKGYQLRVLEIVSTGKAHAESSLSFLREEANIVHRAGAIGIGGLGGLVMGLRGGWFKRIIYGAAGAAAMAALCYPRESAEITEQSLQISKYYFTIAYNFIYGDQIALPVDKGQPLSTPGPVPQVIRDQSNPADKDLYTNRR
ncbi:MICOS complex subunit MIC27 isoform X3 [Cryptotermes secundus]|uniref:MICOS complex subunit MIC27 isoform X3 n=1 Tax=Cryptotermes secundus TaxID=105785 RepID=UPI000CD7BF3E|nr:MICOS complex subunit MIC27 isoform X3 [Cryptotermes secundus]